MTTAITTKKEKPTMQRKLTTTMAKLTRTTMMNECGESFKSMSTKICGEDETLPKLWPGTVRHEYV